MKDFFSVVGAVLLAFALILFGGVARTDNMDEACEQGKPRVIKSKVYVCVVKP